MNHRSLIPYFTLTLCAFACSKETLDPPDDSDPTNGGGSSVTTAGTGSGTTADSSTGSGGSAVTSGGAGTAGSSSGTAGSGSGGSSGQKPLTLPFFVNAPGNFVKSGFMGDAPTSVVAAPSPGNTDGTCGGNRASAKAGGDCDTFMVTPTTGMGWQGVFYQFPSGNWGMLPGRSIAAGAKEVTFSVRASREVSLAFQAGMCDADKADDPKMCADGFFAFAEGADEGHKIMVGKQWAQHTISLSGASYSGGVRGAFSWVLTNTDLLGDESPISIYIDDITWK